MAVPAVPCLFGETTTFEDGSDVTGAMKHTDNHQHVRKRLVINRVRSMEYGTQFRSQFRARDTGERKIAHGLESCRDPIDEIGRDRFGRFGSQINPDFRKVGFRRLR